MFPCMYKQKKAALQAGRVRKDRSTKKLIQRLRPKEIALIDHRDLD